MGRRKIYPMDVKQKAQELRKQGWSLGEISKEMGIVKNTLSVWMKNIALTEKQRENLVRRTKAKIASSGAIGRPIAVRLMREKIEAWKNNIRESVKYFEKFPLAHTDIGKLACGLLYTCEGSKYPSTRGLTFANSDPSVIRCFLYLLRNNFAVNETKLRCRVMYRCDQNIEELKKFWVGVTGIPLTQFFKTTPDERTRGRPTLKPDYKGICAVQYSDTSLQFRLIAIGERIINGAGGI